MFVNRISNYLTKSKSLLAGSDSVGERSQTFRVPAGFAPLPTSLHSAVPQGDIYRVAYEAAQTELRGKLLNLLRARAGWN